MRLCACRFLLLGGFVLLGCRSMLTNPEAVKQQLLAAVPSTPTQVLDYLNKRKIEHSEYLRDPVEGNSIKAILRDQSKWSIVKMNYSIVFQFNDQDRLIAYVVRPAYTGP